jgi:LemA protein
MWSSPLFWMAFAIVLFWALGAYNRLMRLRSAVAQAFGSFDAHMVRLVALLGEFSVAQAAQRVSQADGPDQALVALDGATAQLSACLAVVRSGPLAGDAVAALAAARAVLQSAWQGAERNLGSTPTDPSPDNVGDESPLTPSSPATSLWNLRWNEHALQNDHAASVFNDAVAQYNAAITQFPASLMAWVFGFKPARAI